jgi:hypothetical protein
MNLMPIGMVRIADSPTEPAPMTAIAVFERRRPVNARIRNPAKGKAGMR